MVDDIPVPSSDTEWDDLISAWIRYAEAEKDDPNREENWWAIGKVIDFGLDKNHEAAWEFVTRSFERTMSDKAFAVLAAGSLEDLLSDFGTQYIDRIEQLAQKNSRFNHLLGGVWKSSIADDVWNRITKVRSTEW